MQSVALNLIQALEPYHVWNDDGEESKSLIKGLGFTDEELDMIENIN